MPDFIATDQSDPNSRSFDESDLQIKEMSRHSVIKIGVNALYDIGSDYICKICISNGGSCCNGCRYLANGIGCQQRNTSCTAWLCGFLKYLLYETGLLKEWKDFWSQVPGQDYREDFTPAYFFVNKSLYLKDIRNLSEALAADLQELAQTHIEIGFILTLRENIDENINRLDHCEHDPKKQIKIIRNIKILTRPFHRFQIMLRDYRNDCE